MVNDINMQGLNYKGEGLKKLELSSISKNIRNKNELKTDGNNVKNQPPSYDEWLFRLGSDESSITKTEDKCLEGSIADSSSNEGCLKGRVRSNTISGLRNSFSDIFKDPSDIKKQN